MLSRAAGDEARLGEKGAARRHGRGAASARVIGAAGRRRGRLRAAAPRCAEGSRTASNPHHGEKVAGAGAVVGAREGAARGDAMCTPAPAASCQLPRAPCARHGRPLRSGRGVEVFPQWPSRAAVSPRGAAWRCVCCGRGGAHCDLAPGGGSLAARRGAPRGAAQRHQGGDFTCVGAVSAAARCVGDARQPEGGRLACGQDRGVRSPGGVVGSPQCARCVRRRGGWARHVARRGRFGAAGRAAGAVCRADRGVAGLCESSSSLSLLERRRACSAVL